MASALWKFLASVNLTIWLLLAVTLNLAIGSQYARHLPQVYGRLNDLQFQEWLPISVPAESWWVWSLFFLLFLFGINTAACTADRLLFLVKKRRDYRLGAFAVIAAPSVMHICFLAIIGSHALSQFGSAIHRVPAAMGSAATLPAAASVAVNAVTCDFHSEPRLKGQVKSCTAFLDLKSAAGVTRQDFGVLEPVLWNGYSIHLVPAGKTVPGQTPDLELVVKRDPGLLPIIIGNAALCILMLWYFPIIFKNRNGGNP
jgi:hypothetical protein